MDTTTTKDTALPHIRLRFNIDNPTLEDCYLDGYECAQNELEETENPYTADSQEHELWNQGWWTAFYGEEPIFELSGRVKGEAAEVIPISSVVKRPAANEAAWRRPEVKKWAGRVVKLAGVLAATWAVIELADLAA